MIKVFALINGRDIIATITKETDTTYTVEHALVAMMVPSQAGDGYNVQLIPISPLSDQSDKGSTITINKFALAFEPFDPNSQVTGVYNQIKTPIVLANNVTGFTRN